MAYHTTGTKYQATRDLSRVEIAKLIRADIKAAAAAGELPAGLKVAVRTSRYAGGGSIDVAITAAPLNPVNPAWVSLPDNEKWGPGRTVDRFTVEGQRIAAVIAEIHASYNYDNSDSMTDYFHVRYYGSTGWCGDFLRTCTAEIVDAPIDFAADFGPAAVAAALAEFITEAAPVAVEDPATNAPTLGAILAFRPRQEALPLPAVAGELAPCIAGPAVRVVNEDAARFRFFLGLED